MRLENRLSIRYDMSKVSILDRAIESYYYAIFALYFASMLFPKLRVGVIATGLILLILGVRLFLKSGLVLHVRKNYTAIITYIIWCAVSVIWFGYSGVRYSAFFEGVSNALVPMLFVFFAIDDRDRFWKSFLNAYNLAGIVGTFLLVAQPMWYVRFCIERGFDYRRLSFAYGSIVMGTLGAVAVIAALRFVILSNGKKGKIQYLLTCLFGFLAMQRSAWIVVLATLVIGHYYIIFKFRIVRIRFLIFEIVGIAVVFAFFGTQIMNILNSWIEVRQFHYGGSITLTAAFTERSDQWIRGIENSNLLIGSGFGSRGHKAAAGGFANYIADGNWLLILCESGIIGLLCFVYINLKGLKRGIKDFKELFLPVGVILIFMFQAIGSNVWEQQLIAPIYWFALGQILSYSK